LTEQRPKERHSYKLQHPAQRPISWGPRPVEDVDGLIRKT